MNRITTVSALVLVAACRGRAAMAQGGVGESMLLQEPVWLLRSAGHQQLVWFERGARGVELVACSRGSNCRAPVLFDDRGLRVAGTVDVSFQSAPASSNVPIFESPSGALLMPAWVVPVAGSRTGH